jgi:hypothetical protein
LRLDLGHPEGLAQPSGEQHPLAIHELGIPFTGAEEIGLIIAFRRYRGSVVR